MRKFLILFLAIGLFMFFNIDIVSAGPKPYGCPYCKILVFQKLDKCPICDGSVEEIKDGYIAGKVGSAAGKASTALLSHNTHLCPECGKMQWAVIYSSPACLTKSFDSQKRCPDGRKLTKKEIVGFAYHCPKDRMFLADDPGVCPSGSKPEKQQESLEEMIEGYRVKMRDEGKEYIPSQGIPKVRRFIPGAR